MLWRIHCDVPKDDVMLPQYRVVYDYRDRVATRLEVEPSFELDLHTLVELFFNTEVIVSLAAQPLAILICNFYEEMEVAPNTLPLQRWRWELRFDEDTMSLLKGQYGLVNMNVTLKLLHLALGEPLVYWKRRGRLV